MSLRWAFRVGITFAALISGTGLQADGTYIYRYKGVGFASLPVNAASAVSMNDIAAYPGLNSSSSPSGAPGGLSWAVSPSLPSFASLNAADGRVSASPPETELPASYGPFIITGTHDGKVAAKGTFSVVVRNREDVPSGTGILPALLSASGFSPATPVTAERLHNANNVFIGSGQLPNHWCVAATCEVVLDYGNPHKFNVLRVFASSRGMNVDYDLGDGNWKALWTYSDGINVEDASATDAYDYSRSFPLGRDVILRRVRISSNSDGPWGHLTEFRMGYGSAPPIIQFPSGPAPTASGLVPSLVSSVGFNPQTPVTAARLNDGNNVWIEQDVLPYHFCMEDFCRVVLDYGQTFKFNVMQILGSAEWIVVEADSGDGIWRPIWTSHSDGVIEDSSETGASDYSKRVDLGGERLVRRVKVTLTQRGRSYLTEFRMGYGAAPVVNPRPEGAAPEGTGVLPTLVSAFGFSSNTPVTAARLNDGNNVYAGYDTLPFQYCIGSGYCSVVLDYRQPYKFNEMRILGYAIWVIVDYDSGDGIWRPLRSLGTNGEIADMSATVGNDYTQRFDTGGDIILRRVRVTMAGNHPWTYLTEFRMGYGSAPIIP